MTSDKHPSPLTHERPDLANDRRFDAAHIGDENLRSGRKGGHLPDDGGHMAGRHGEDKAVGALDRLVDNGGGKVDQSGLASNFFHRLGPTGPSGQGGARTTGTEGAEERPPDQPGRKHGDPAERGFAFGAQGTLK